LNNVTFMTAMMMLLDEPRDGYFCSALKRSAQNGIANEISSSSIRTARRNRDRSHRDNMPPRYREWDLSCKVYVGNLGSSATKHEIESSFMKYGPLKNVWVARNPPGFAFVEFEDKRDAEDAVRALDGS